MLKSVVPSIPLLCHPRASLARGTLLHSHPALLAAGDVLGTGRTCPQVTAGAQVTTHMKVQPVRGCSSAPRGSAVLQCSSRPLRKKLHCSKCHFCDQAEVTRLIILRCANKQRYELTAAFISWTMLITGVGLGDGDCHSWPG